MRNLNRLKFDEYSSISFLKNQEDGENYFRMLANFPKTLGYDSKTNGFIVLHKKHSPSGLESELPACKILKKLGYRVVLVEESPHTKSLDALIDDVPFEIKCYSEGKDLLQGVTKHFRKTYKKAKNLVLHIDKKVEFSNLKRSIRKASLQYPKIETVLLIYGYNAILLDKQKMGKADYSM